jgi:ankyrin repeat protein
MHPPKQNSDLVSAVKQHNEGLVAKLLEEGIDPNATNTEGETPLHAAAFCGAYSIARLLLKSRARPDVPDLSQPGKTLLHLAVERQDVVMVEMLLEAGADPDVKDNSYCAPLHRAAQEGCMPIVKLLLGRQADLNAVTKDGHTPLFMAARRRHIDVATMLIKEGAVPDLRDKTGQIVLGLETMRVLVKAAERVSKRLR